MTIEQVPYMDAVLSKLIGLKDGWVTIDKQKEDYNKKVEMIKTIIDWGFDRLNGFIIEFSNDYSRIKKFTL